jgi:hypothetical protein
MTTISICPDCEPVRFVFAELAIGEKDLEELHGNEGPSATIVKKSAKWLTFHRSSAARVDDSMVLSPNENPTPTGWSTYNLCIGEHK